MFGKTLKIFVRGNKPHSLKSVELSNWTGMAFVGERSQLKEACAIDELSDTAIYLLLASPEDDGSLTEIYIGETENFSKRILSHKKKEWWTKFVVFISKDRNLTKAHVRFLEQKLYSLATQALSTLEIKNDTVPGGAKLPEPDEASMDEFSQNIIFVLETLGLSYFPNNDRESSTPPEESDQKPDYSSTLGMEFYMNVPNSDETGTMVITGDGQFVLKKGSSIRSDTSKSFPGTSYHRIWQQITNSDAVEKSANGSVFTTTRDLEFRSPSAAGAVVRGAATNGRKRWKRKTDDKPLVECETEGLDSVA